MKSFKEFIFENQVNQSHKVDYIDPDDGSSSLMIAVLHHDLKKVKSLIEEGANVNIQDRQGTTALIWAITLYNDGYNYRGSDWNIEENKLRLDIIVEILKAKPNLSLKDKDGEGFWDMMNTHPRCKKYLFSIDNDDIQELWDAQKYNL